MPHLCANLSFLFTEHPWDARFDAAAAAGFDTVELNLPAPYQFTLAEFARRLTDAGLACATILAPAGPAPGEEMGIAARRGADPLFRDTVERSISYAAAARVGIVHVLAGILDEHEDRPGATSRYVEALGHAAGRAAEHDVIIGIEPVCQFRFPGYFVSRTSEAVSLMRRIGAGNLRLIYDVFQAQMEEGQISRSLREHLADIGLIQIGNPPGRNEPGEGEIDFPFVLRLIDELGYRGVVSCEYHPKHETLHSLAWAREWGIGAVQQADRSRSDRGVEP